MLLNYMLIQKKVFDQLCLNICNINGGDVIHDGKKNTRPVELMDVFLNWYVEPLTQIDPLDLHALFITLRVEGEFEGFYKHGLSGNGVLISNTFGS